MNTSEIFFVIVNDEHGGWRPCFLCGLHAERNRAELKMKSRHPSSMDTKAVSMKEFQEMFCQPE